MKLEQTGSRQWHVVTPLGFKFTFGAALGSDDLFEVFSDKIKLPLSMNTEIGNVFQQLAKVHLQIQLKSYPYREEDYDFRQLSEGIESVLRAVGIQSHVQEYGDEEEDYKPYEYDACFADGNFEYRETTPEKTYNVYTLVKYGDCKTLLIKRTQYTAHRILDERTHHLYMRSPITAMTPEEAIQYFD